MILSESPRRVFFKGAIMGLLGGIGFGTWIQIGKNTYGPKCGTFKGAKPRDDSMCYYDQMSTEVSRAIKSQIFRSP